MSFKAMAWAYEQLPEPAERLSTLTLRMVLIGLANYAHDGEEEGVHVTWVSAKRLADENGVDERTVRRAIAGLEAQGYLVRTRRRRADGTWSTYRYALAVPPASSAAGPTSGPQARWVEPEPEHEPDQPPGPRPAHEPQALTSLEPQALELVSEQGIKRARPADLLFEAVAEACGIDWHDLTKSARGPLNRAVAELRAVEATPAEVHRRAAEYRARFAVPLTPTALAKHWPSLGEPDAPRVARSALHPVDQWFAHTVEEIHRREEAQRGGPDGGGAGAPPVRGLPGDQTT